MLRLGGVQGGPRQQVHGDAQQEPQLLQLRQHGGEDDVRGGPGGLGQDAAAAGDDRDGARRAADQLHGGHHRQHRVQQQQQGQGRYRVGRGEAGPRVQVLQIVRSVGDIAHFQQSTWKL